MFCNIPGGRESRQAKLASRVKLKRTEDTDANNQHGHEEVLITLFTHICIHTYKYIKLTDSSCHEETKNVMFF